MALDTSLRFVSRKIGQAVEIAAKNQNLSREDYFLFGTYDEDSDHISLDLKVGQRVNDHQLFSDIFQEIRRLLPDFVSITLKVGLVIRRIERLDDVDRDSLSAGERDITDLLERAMSR